MVKLIIIYKCIYLPTPCFEPAISETRRNLLLCCGGRLSNTNNTHNIVHISLNSLDQLSPKTAKGTLSLCSQTFVNTERWKIIREITTSRDNIFQNKSWAKINTEKLDTFKSRLFRETARHNMAGVRESFADNYDKQ